jgi:hypothetical protein
MIEQSDVVTLLMKIVRSCQACQSGADNENGV